jgi:hypothetical protein
MRVASFGFSPQLLVGGSKATTVKQDRRLGGNNETLSDVMRVCGGGTYADCELRVGNQLQCVQIEHWESYSPQNWHRQRPAGHGGKKWGRSAKSCEF